MDSLKSKEKGRYGGMSTCDGDRLSAMTMYCGVTVVSRKTFYKKLRMEENEKSTYRC